MERFYRSEVDHEHRRIYTTWERLVSDASLESHYHSICGDAKLSHYDECIDFTGVQEIHVSTRFLTHVAQDSSAQERDPPPKLAIVAPSALAFGLARMYESLHEVAPGRGKEVAVFEDVEAANRWMTGGREQSDSHTPVD